jgi:hypothetical protein
MAGFVDDGGAIRGRAEPAESWLRPAHRRARKLGWIRLGMKISIEGARPGGIWFPTEKGEIAAREARERTRACAEAREAWARDFLAAHRAQRAKDLAAGDDAGEEATECDPM